MKPGRSWRPDNYVETSEGVSGGYIAPFGERRAECIHIYRN